MISVFYENTSLGILAGGRGLRLDGANKAFIRHENEYLSQRILNRLDIRFAAQLISAREPDDRYIQMNLQPVFDSRPAFSGPLAGVEALLEATKTEYLLSMPVDIKTLPLDVIAQWLDTPERPGLVLQDSNGLQPLLALWHVVDALPAVKQALDRKEKAVHSVISQLNFKIIPRTDIQIGNLNTPKDFQSP